MCDVCRARDVFTDPLRAPCAMMLEWNPALIHSFEGRNASSLIEETEQMLRSAGYRFLRYNDVTNSFEDLVFIEKSAKFFRDGNLYTDYFVVRDHPECFERNGVNWNKLTRPCFNWRNKVCSWQ